MKGGSAHIPVVERKWPRSRPTKLSGFVRTFVLPATAVSQSPRHKKLHAL